MKQDLLAQLKKLSAEKLKKTTSLLLKHLNSTSPKINKIF